MLLGGAIGLPVTALAQTSSKVYRVGTLNTAAPLADDSPFAAAFLRGLAQRGYVMGRNLAIERLGADMQIDRMPHLVEEFAARKVDAVVAFGYFSALALKQSGVLPTVSFSTGDPVGTGLVDSLARPGGNLTGISDVSAEVTPKRIELLKDLAPGLHQVAMLWNASDPGMTLRYRSAETGARAMGINVQPLGVREPNDFDHAFAAMTSNMPDAILMVSDPLINLNRRRVFDFANAHRLPAIYENDLYVRDGGLMSYGPDLEESLTRVAALVDRILKGAKPGDLPFEQPTLFRFAINLKSAKSIGLEVPASLLAGADEVIE